MYPGKEAIPASWLFQGREQLGQNNINTKLRCIAQNTNVKDIPNAEKKAEIFSPFHV